MIIVLRLISVSSCSLLKTNYRPITILPAISKVFEKIVHCRISPYFEEIYHKYVFAYRKYHGCDSALLSLTEQWKKEIDNWFAPVIEGLLYVEDFTTNWFLRTWPYMEFICTCSSIVNWKIKLIWQRRLLHMSISVEATGKILYLQFVFHMRLVSFEVRSVVTLLKCKLRNELLGFLNN